MKGLILLLNQKISHQKNQNLTKQSCSVLQSWSNTIFTVQCFEFFKICIYGYYFWSPKQNKYDFFGQNKCFQFKLFLRFYLNLWHICQSRRLFLFQQIVCTQVRHKFEKYCSQYLFEPKILELIDHFSCK